MLDVQNISFAPLFSDLSFSIQNRESLVIRGANGTGKSTLLRILAGLIRGASGTIWWEGQPITAAYQQKLFYSGHRLALHPEALLKEQVRLWQHHYGAEMRFIEEGLERWGVRDLLSQKIDHLSQGQQKRISLSRCHWIQRPLWILDEPQASLDEEGWHILQKALAHHQQNGGLVVLASHEELPGMREICL